MKLPFIDQNFVRIVGRLTKKADDLHDEAQVLAMQSAVMAEQTLKHEDVRLEHTFFRAARGDDLCLTLLGSVDAKGSAASYRRGLRSVQSLLDESQLAFAPVRGEMTDPLRGLLEQYGVCDVVQGAPYMSASIYSSNVGHIGVVSYQRYSAEARRRPVRVDLMRQIRRLKQSGAEFIIVYVNDRSRKENTIGKREKNLFDMIARMGADYIVGVSPDLRDGGATYSYHGKTQRAVYSVGTFLTSSAKRSTGRVVLRLVLRRIHGELTLVQETYYPFEQIAGRGMVSLLTEKAEIAGMKPETLRRAAQLEHEMIRIRPANRMLTVEKMFEVMGEELPKKLEYMRDFSVGKVCARSYECRGGDAFFFRQTFDDPNDLVPSNPKTRERMVRRMSHIAQPIISYRKVPLRTPYAVVPDTIEAHIAVCAYLRNQFPVSYIGITGSVGKTSTKDMLYEVMSMRFRTLKSEKNSNVQVKIGLDIQKLTSDCEVFIQELGGGRPGGASRHSRMILPDVTVITNIGDAHIGNFYGDRTKLMENKLGIGDGMPEDGLMLLNGDDPLLVTAKPPRRAIYYAVHNQNADYYVEDIRELGGYTTFLVVRRGRKTRVRLNVLGEHNILNAVCCFAIGEHYGIPVKDIVEGLSHFETSGIRQNLVRVCGVSLFMDCYNASSESMKSSLEVLSKIPTNKGGKRVALIGDITGMGDEVENVHRHIADTVLQTPPDHTIFFGTSIREAYDIVKEHGLSVFYTTDRDELNAHLDEVMKPGNVLMAKGSSKMLLEYSVDMVFGTRFTDLRMVEKVRFRKYHTGHVHYNLFADYATAVRSAGLPETIRIRSHIGKIPVVNLGGAIGHSKLKKVIMPDTIRHIDSRAFHDCGELTTVRFSTGVKMIGNAAFKNCAKLQSAELYEGLRHIGSEAFRGCASLRELFIPESVAQIGKNAFADCSEMHITCVKDSYADRYLTRNNIAHDYC